MRRVRLILLVAVLLMADSICASDSGNAGRESLFSLGAGGRAMGLGGASVAMGSDASTIYYNAAGLPWLEYQEISAMHVTLFDGTLYDVASWGVPVVGVGGFGAAFMRVGTGDIIRRNGFVNEGTFDYATWQFLFGYGRTFGQYLSLGSTFKIVNQALDKQSDYGLGADLGLQIKLYRGFSFGLVLRNIAPPELTLDSSSDRMPLELVGGLALHDFRLSQFMTVTSALDIEKVTDHPSAIHAGLEVGLLNRLALRTGYDRNNVSFGAGLSAGRIRVDYAYKILDYIEDSHRFSLSVLLGPSISTQLERREQEVQQRSKAALEEERKRQFAAYRSKADEYYRVLRLDSALSYYQRALAFDEKNQEIIGTIAAIENIQRIKAEEEARIKSAQQELQQTVRAYFDQADFLYNRRYFPAALDLLSLIFEIEPDNVEARLLRDTIRSAMTSEIETARALCIESEKGGRLLDAVEACNRVLELSPGDSVAVQTRQRISARMDITEQLKLGIDLFNQNRMAEAKRQFEAVLKINPQEAVAKEYIAKMDTLPPQETTLENIQNDREIWPLYLEGLRHMRNKDYQKAIDSWELVLKKYPNNSNAIDNIKQARLRLES